MKNNIQASLIELLDTQNVLTGEDLKERFFHIWHMEKPLMAKAMVFPRSTEEVAAILKLCNELGQSVIVYGGLTNLVGSTETSGSEVLISMEKMNQLLEIDVQSRTMTVQSGIILEEVQNAAAEKNLLFPLNYGAKGSAQIGGAISTNAGGLRVFRFGMIRNLILGLEVVLPDGTIISSLKKIIKDNSGYDLKQLFIGAEGTLGVVTKAVLKLSERPKSRNSAYVGLDHYDQVIALLKYLDAGLAGTLSGFELIWKDSFRALTSPPSTSKAPLPYDYNYYVLVETLGSHQENDRKRLEELLEKALLDELIRDAAFAYTEADLNWFWTIREDVRGVVSLCTHEQYYDISLPVGLIGEQVNHMLDELRAIPEVNLVLAFGHVADGNIHLIVSKTKESQTLSNQINDIVYLPLQAIGGSISAEHGIGLHKKEYLHISRTPQEIQLMKSLKKAMDPKGILNPGKILDNN